MPYKDKDDPRHIEYKKQRAERVNRWRRNLKTKIVNALGGSCQVCGYNRCNSSMDLHHVDPSEKEYAFRDVMANPKSVEKMMPELEKCMLLCANCHREYHAGFIELPKEYAKFDKSKFILEKIE